jgi:peptidoglycan lytic transglycosylase
MALTCIKTVRRELAALAIALVCAPSFAQTAGDAEFLAAKDAAQRGQWKVLDSLRGRLSGHVLEAYPTYWLLAGTVDRAPPGEVQAFLARYPDSPLSESLRREWLRALGAAHAWDEFRAEYPKLIGDDVEITCFSFQERLQRGDAETMGEVRALYVSGRETPPACDPVFQAAGASNVITDMEAWERIRKLLAAGSVKDAKRTNATLAGPIAIPERALDHAARDASRYLANEKPGKQGTRAQQELLIFAIERDARSKSDEAAERLATLAPRLDGASLRYAWGQVAWQAALNHHPRALEWYANAGDATLSDAQVAWKARAAMRAGDWKAVFEAIKALPPEDAREPTWRYWRSRALRAMGEGEAADGLLRGLAGHQNFYGILASEELGLQVVPEWNGFRPNGEDLERVRRMDGIRRALELYRLGLDNEALREWLWAIRGLDDRGLLAAAEVARIANEPDRAINTANRTVLIHDYAQRFPTPHRDALAASARQWNLDEAIVYGIVRQESRFMPEARSRVGATGLMQLMPATARWVARQIQIRPFKPDMLVRPELNLQMGTYYFGRVLTDLGHPILATAAYNAGPGRARRWRDERPLEGAVYAETIPFSETRDYVKNVFTNAWFYRHRLTGKPASLHDLLGTVPGRAGEPPNVASNIP